MFPIQTKPLHGFAITLAVAALAAGVSCSSGSDPTPRKSASAAGGQSGAAGVGANAAAGGNAATGTGGGTGQFTGIIDYPTADADATAGPLKKDAACAGTSAQASLMPVSMYVMFDESGSMASNNKWIDASAALIAFFQDPGTAGMGVTLRFFPSDTPRAGCNNQDCVIAACQEPLLAMGTLTADPAPQDAQEQALVSAVKASGPGTGAGSSGRGSGGTPLSAALAGAENWVVSYVGSHPDQKVVVVLVTDGEPNGCDEDVNHIAGLAATTLASNGILTYAIGLEGSQVAQMDQIAQAGGTTAGYFIGSGTTAQNDLVAALNDIRGKSLSCDIAMPQSSDAGKIDSNLVSVIYTPGDAQNAITLGQAKTAADCGTLDGWYYDNPAAPTKVQLCETTCSKAKSDPKAKLELLLGCASPPIRVY